MKTVFGGKFRFFLRELIDKICKPKHKSIFSRIYKNKLWGELPTVSGPGSVLEQTYEVRKHLPLIFEKYKIKTMADAPCGDFFWMKEVNLAQIDYIGIDVVDELILMNKKMHESAKIKFMQADIISDSLPLVDLVLCRDMMIHLPNALVLKALANIKKSGARYLLATTFDHITENRDIKIAEWRPLNLQKKPFNLPEPVLKINERCTLNDPAAAYKYLALWQINQK